MRILQAIFYFFYDILLGCRHHRLTRLFTLQQQTYKVCLDCGRHLYYSMDTMRPLRGRDLRRVQAALAGEMKIMPVADGVRTLTAASDSQAVA